MHKPVSQGERGKNALARHVLRTAQHATMGWGQQIEGRKPMRFRDVFWGIVALWLLSGCAPEPQMLGAPTRTFPTRVLAAITSTSLPALPTTSVVPSGCGDAACGDIPHYELDASLDWETHTLQVEQRVRYTNTTAHTLASVVFDVEPAREPNIFALAEVRNGGRPVRNYALEGTRLVVPLLQPLDPAASVQIVLRYTLTIPQIQNGYHYGHLGYWGYSARQVNLGMWFPLVAAYDPVAGWQSPTPHHVGEHFELAEGDFFVRLRVRNAPAGLRVAGAGQVARPERDVWEFSLEGGREIALSLSPDFHTLTTTADGVRVMLYYLDDPAVKIPEAPRHALQTAADALALYSELYGPYPYTRLVVVMGDFPDGMEFSGLVFVSEAWFRLWSGTPDDWLTIITAHEVAHQWWYALVGNDQGHAPYLDEALATYSEALFFERYYPELLPWWGNFRIIAYEPSGNVDATVYDFQSARPYINAVYLRGAQMLADLRLTLGDEVFFAWLQAYCAHMSGRIATPRDFWGQMSPDAYRATAPVREQYLRQPDVLAASDRIP